MTPNKATWGDQKSKFRASYKKILRRRAPHHALDYFLFRRGDRVIEGGLNQTGDIRFHFVSSRCSQSILFSHKYLKQSKFID